MQLNEILKEKKQVKKRKKRRNAAKYNILLTYWNLVKLFSWEKICIIFSLKISIIWNYHISVKRTTDVINYNKKL